MWGKHSHKFYKESDQVLVSCLIVWNIRILEYLQLHVDKIVNPSLRAEMKHFKIKYI